MGVCWIGEGFLPQQLCEQSELRPNQSPHVEQPGKATPTKNIPQTQRSFPARMAVAPLCIDAGRPWRRAARAIGESWNQVKAKVIDFYRRESWGSVNEN